MASPWWPDMVGLFQGRIALERHWKMLRSNLDQLQAGLESCQFPSADSQQRLQETQVWTFSFVSPCVKKSVRRKFQKVWWGQCFFQMVGWCLDVIDPFPWRRYVPCPKLRCYCQCMSKIVIVNSHSKRQTIIASFHEAIHLLSKQEHYMFASVKARNSSFFSSLWFSPTSQGLLQRISSLQTLTFPTLQMFQHVAKNVDGQSILDCMEKFVSVQLA